MLRDDLISTSITYHHGIAVLAITGEMDLATAPAVEHAIAAVLAQDPPSLIIDLSGVQFLGSIGVGALVKARNYFADGDRFSVVAHSRMTSRVIQLLGMERVLSLQKTVEEALSTAKVRRAPVTSPAHIPRQPLA